MLVVPGQIITSVRDTKSAPYECATLALSEQNPAASARGLFATPPPACVIVSDSPPASVHVTPR